MRRTVSRRERAAVGPTATELQHDTGTSETAGSGDISRETRRLLPVVAPVVVAGAAVVVAALAALLADIPEPTELAGLAVLLAAATLVEIFPVPIERVPVGGTSLATVFILGSVVIYGWAPGILVAALAQVLVEVGRRQPPVRVAFNTAVYALSAAAAGGAAAAAPDRGFGWLAVEVALAATAFYAVDLPLVAAVLSRSARRPFLSLLRSALSSTSIAFAIMASLALMLTVLWERSPFLAAALLGPLAAIALYQRSVHSELESMRLALTDPLTGLGNHRHFQERLAEDVATADADGVVLSLVVLDVDNFKEINDTYGHPAGDRVLAEVASRLRQDGEAFRIGGDEFAVLLPGVDEPEAVVVAEGVLGRIVSLRPAPDLRVQASAGVVTYPQLGVDRTEVVRLADRALYLAKDHGKGRVRAFRPDLDELAELTQLAEGPDRAARLRAAASLAHAVDARDAYTGSHSYTVGEISARIATLLNLPAEEVELVRLAGSLHDLGKLAIPEEILRKAGPLTEEERLVLERHPQIGFRMLDSLGVEPVAGWVLHHHERWDGTGYPERLGSDLIPLGSRIVFVADAYDAMTSERVYMGAISHDEAVAELERCAGSQFDPEIVAAFVAGVSSVELAVLKSA
jgi:diguanylate cyclase (GGDEF)-like protein